MNVSLLPSHWLAFLVWLAAMTVILPEQHLIAAKLFARTKEPPSGRSGKKESNGDNSNGFTRPRRLAFPPKNKISAPAVVPAITANPMPNTQHTFNRRNRVKKSTTSTTTAVHSSSTDAADYDAADDDAAEEEDADDGVDDPTVGFQPPTSNFTALYTWEALLMRKLFEESEYNNKARPALYNGKAVNVTLELVLLKINELVEIDQEIVISGFLKISWNDNRLTWDKDKYGGIEWIVSDIAYIWLPDLALINSDDVYALTRDNRFPIRLSSKGNVLFVPAGKISARCELDLRFFPFDEQLCKYRFESWVYTSDLVVIHGINFSIDNNHYVQNPQWKILNSFVRSRIVGYENYNFSQVDFFLQLQRKSLFFLTYTVFPSAIISSLQIMSHVLPFTESERINFGTTTLIAFSVFHISVVEQVPKSSEFVPLLAIYVDSLMCLISLSLVECFFIMNWMTRVGITVPSPVCWYWLVEIFGRFLWLGANGEYWRRNYLRVLLSVNRKKEVYRRRNRELAKLAATLQMLKQRITAREKAERLRAMGMDEMAGFSRGETQALIGLVNKWGDFACDLLNDELSNEIGTARTFGVKTSKRNQSPSSSNASTLRRRATTLNSTNSSTASQQQQQQQQPPITVNVCQNNHRSGSNRRNSSCSPRLHGISNELPPSLSVNEQLLNIDEAFARFNEDAERSALIAAGKTQQSSLKSRRPSPVPAKPPAVPRHHQHQQQQQQQQQQQRQQSPGHGSNKQKVTFMNENAKPVGAPGKSGNETAAGDYYSNVSHQRRSTVAGGPATTDSFRFFEFSQQQRQLNDSYSSYSEISKTNAVPQSQPQSSSSSSTNTQKHDSYSQWATLQDMTKQLDALENIANMLEDISGNVTTYSLKRECHGVWSTYITAVDRIISIGLLGLFVGTPVYLFWFYPSKVELVPT